MFFSSQMHVDLLTTSMVGAYFICMARTRPFVVVNLWNLVFDVF